MKRIILLVFVFIFLPTIVFTQTISNIEYISPEIEGVIAIKKGNQWAFITNQGEIIVDFRSDLVSTKHGNDSFPIFSNDRCLISVHKEGIEYFGYIDKTGKIVIDTQFLNALNFDNNVALVIQLFKEELSNNQYLNKPIVKNRSIEIIINTDGKKLYNATKPKNVLLRKDHLKKPPVITSKLISDTIIATKENKKWVIQKIK